MKKTIKKILIIVLVIIAVPAAAWAFQYYYRYSPSGVKTYETTNQFITETAEVSAHRCGGGIYPENTMMAIRGCLENDSFCPDLLEFDIHMTSDNVPILLHDNEFDRTSDCEQVLNAISVEPEDYTYEELMKLNLGAKFTDEDGNQPYAGLSQDEVPDDLRVVTLYEALDYIVSQSDTVQVIIEVKSDGQKGLDCVDAVYQAVTERGILDRTIFATFNSELSLYEDAHYPDMARGAYMGEVTDFLKAALTDDDDFEVNYEVLQIPYNSIKDSYGINLGTTWLINYAHKHNIAVQYWTIDKEKDMEYLASIGADSITTNYPDKACSLLKDE